jgi:hypothetical protein
LHDPVVQFLGGRPELLGTGLVWLRDGFDVEGLGMTIMPSCQGAFLTGNESTDVGSDSGRVRHRDFRLSGVQATALTVRVCSAGVIPVMPVRLPPAGSRAKYGR